MGTGTAWLFVPQKIYDAIQESQAEKYLTIRLSSGSTWWEQWEHITLKFDVATLMKNQWIKPQYDSFILGLPVWAYYYTVFNVKESTVSFVEHAIAYDFGA